MSLARLPRIALHLTAAAFTLGTLQAFAPKPSPTVEAVPAVAAATVVAAPPTAETVAVETPAEPIAEPVAYVPDTAAARAGWRGTAAREANVRTAPRRDAPVVRELKPGEAVAVERWVAGDEIEKLNPTWAEIAPGQFVYSMLLRSRPLAATPAAPANGPKQGKWIDVNLTLQVATAYEGSTAVRSVLISTGKPGWETPEGTFPIIRRVEKETMDGSTLIGQGPNGAGSSYRIENVKYTQYFTADGSAIHENTWRPAAAFGMPGSHGCIGMLPEDAAFFWTWASTGTPLVIHR